MSTDLSFKDGDVFFWRYKNDGSDKYWCCSRIGIVRNGRLEDTYWGSSGGNRSWSHDEASNFLELDFQANLADLEKISEHDAKNYDARDIVNCNHSNSTRDNCYKRKGANRSAAAMLERIAYRKERAQSDIRHAEYTLNRLDEAEKAIASGADLGGIYV